MGAPRAEGGTVAAPYPLSVVPANVVGVALVPEAAGYDNIMINTLDIEATFGQVATSLALGVLAAHLTSFPFAALPF
jgi:hypothetical protein